METLIPIRPNVFKCRLCKQEVKSGLINVMSHYASCPKRKIIFVLFFFLPLSAFAQIEPTAAIQAGVNSGTMLHVGVETGISINRRFTASVDYNAFVGNYEEHVAGLKAGVAVFYRDSEGLCPIYLITGVSRAYYKDMQGKAKHSTAPTLAVRVQAYNGFWEVGRQNGYWCVTVGYQFRRIYE